MENKKDTRDKKFLEKHVNKVVGTMVAVGLLSLVVVFGGTASAAPAGFWDRLADKAGEALGVSLAEQAPGDVLGTNVTVNPQTGSYNDEVRQNIQAFGEKLASSTQNSILQADSQGRMQPTTLANLVLTGMGTTTVEKFTQGGSVFASTSAAISVTLTENTMASYGRWSLIPMGSILTVTIPPTTSISSWLPNTGDRAEIQVYNATTTAGVRLVIAAGSGIDLETPSSATTTVGIAPQATGLLDCMRKADTDITCLLKSFVDAD